ncbi:hypothetical protein [Ruminococcus flavefaciens]|uniref:hypothetical protein n=1 Tax=Ruminococcus flavefaciens TaxID=1265 RepID=UPI00094347A7|nr:hypothetical protein [Ruminococcus flavefaciens]MBQ6181152.1 hypothetical protein [Ruminococcus sp.]
MVYKSFFKAKRLSLAQQKAALCQTFANSKCKIINNKLIWKSQVQPTHLSRKYNIELQYSINSLPRIYILGDALKKLDDPNFPHNYGVDVAKKKVEICLFRYKEFTNSMLLSNTVIPWAIEWLFYYEIWLTTGEWQGGGEHPES